MEKEENAYETTEGTEDTTLGRNRVESTAEKDASAVPEKFKDVDALARAYTALQAEFTRRSQRLKELEKQLDNLNAAGGSGAEKLRKNARVRKEESERFDHFLAETEKRNVGEKSSAQEPTMEQPSMGVGVEKGRTMYEMNTIPDTEKTVDRGDGVGVETAIDEASGQENVSPVSDVGNAQTQGEGKTSVADSGRVETDAQNLYAQVCRDENVRLKIIGEYLSSLGRSDAPLMRGGVGTFASPPKKASSIAEAGDMALLYLKKPKN